MAALVMQALGCDVAALNTVQFSRFPGPEDMFIYSTYYQSKMDGIFGAG